MFRTMYKHLQFGHFWCVPFSDRCNTRALPLHLVFQSKCACSQLHRQHREIRIYYKTYKIMRCFS